MAFYRFDYQYTARGSRIIEFDNDDEARKFGWDDPDDLIDTFYDYDWDIDADDVEITEVDADGEDIRSVYEED